MSLESVNTLVLYTKEGCGACARAKDALGLTTSSSSSSSSDPASPSAPLHTLSVSISGPLSSILDESDVSVVDLKIGAEGERGAVDSAEFDRLAKISGRRTVPVVFIGGEYVGGGDEVVAMGKSGALLLRLLLAKSGTSSALAPWKAAATSFLSSPPAPAPAGAGASAPNTKRKRSRSSPLADYSSLYDECSSLIASESDPVVNAANVSSAIYQAYTSSVTNWVGFYFARRTPSRTLLVLGPFQGKPACKRIPYSEGVCGAAARTKQVQRVDDVHSFPGHIACDGASNSEVRGDGVCVCVCGGAHPEPPGEA